MSDPMTNVQIEDVLSSIRRLVAEGEKSRAAKGDSEADTPATQPAKDGRLVLTPALRVGADGLRISKTPESDNSASKPHVVPDDRTAAQVASMSRNDDWPVPDATPEPSKEPLILKPAEKTSDPIDLLCDEPPTPEPAFQSARKPRLHLSPVDRVKDDDANTSFHHFDRDRLSADKTPLRELDDPDLGDSDEDLGPEVDAAYLSDDEIIASAGLDEALLRTMVIDIIREELQGAWGEKITRNVRKLVRREINRVLSSQEFD